MTPSNSVLASLCSITTLLLIVAWLPSRLEAVELTTDNFDQRTSDKILFLKFYQPTSQQCRDMEEAWNEITTIYAHSKTKLIGEIDCTKVGTKELFQQFQVQSFPTVKYGSVHDLHDYEGPRDVRTLKAFIDHHLKPTCGIHHVQLCEKKMRKEIRRLQKLSLDELDEELEAKTEELNAIDTDWKQAVDDMNTYHEMQQKRKDDAIQDILHQDGLLMMKAVAKERGIDLHVE